MVMVLLNLTEKTEKPKTIFYQTLLCFWPNTHVAYAYGPM